MTKVFNNLKEFYKFIQNYEGELTIINNVVYSKNEIVARYEKKKDLQ